MDEVSEFLRGAVRYGAEVGPADAAHLVFVRSDLASGSLTRVDSDAASAMPGVLGVFTAADLDLPAYTQVGGQPDEHLQPPLASGEVRYVGQRVAAVVAETLPQAVDAAEVVAVEIESRAPVLDIDDAFAQVLDVEIGSARPAGPDEVSITLETRQPRVAPSPLESTTVCVEPHAAGDVTVHVGTQLPSGTHADLARCLDLEPDRLRLLSVPMGGAFGAKTVGGSPDLTVPAACALKLGRTVRFVEDRSSHTSVNHARDQRQIWTLTADAAGRLRHVTLEATADAGAYVSTGAMEPATTALLVTGPYRIDEVHVRATAVLTNTAPTGPYRGPGRAEASAGLERAMDVLAAELGLDPLDLRRRNLLTPDEYPRTTPTGLTYDASDPQATLDAALRLIDAPRWLDEKRSRLQSAAPLLIGVGVSTWVDATAGYFAQQESSVCVTPDGSVSLLAGAAPAGQGHQRTFGGLVGTRLGIDAALVVVEMPDSAGAVASVGSFGSRSGQIVASAVDEACRTLDGQARILAAHLLEASPADLVTQADGRIGVAGVPDRSLSIIELGQRAHELDQLPPGVEPGLASTGSFAQDQRTFPAGCHAAVVEVDVETGGVTLLGLVTVTDCGTVLQADSATGQAQGSMVQGAAQALFEQVVYDESGNLLTGNLLTYGLPSAAELPALGVRFHPVPTDRNPLGAKGLGETGAVGAPAAVQNAVVDALGHLGVRHVEMPCTPERVWTALRAAGR